MKIDKWKYVDLNNQNNYLLLHTKGTFKLILNEKTKTGFFLDKEDKVILQPTCVEMTSEYILTEQSITFQKEDGCLYGNYSIWIPKECWGSECVNPNAQIEIGVIDPKERIDCTDVDSSKDRDPYTITGK